MSIYRGKTALITGASSGIGEAFARALAARGASVILVARSADRLQAIASELATKYSIRAESIAADLSEPSAVARVVDEVRSRADSVDLLVNNAGFGLHGPFETLDAERERREIQLTVGTLVELTSAFVPEMLARSSGAIVNVASTLGFQPVPYMAVYAATKAFVRSFSQALAEEEYRGRGIRVLALCPGATSTPFYGVSGGEEAFARMRMRTPEQVAATGLRALARGHTSAIDGASNRLLFRALATVPDQVGARILGHVMRPKRE
jgi:short-subunit dehydrogenase